MVGAAAHSSTVDIYASRGGLFRSGFGTAWVSGEMLKGKLTNDLGVGDDEG